MPTFQSYIEDTLKEAGYSDSEVNSALNKLVNHEKIGPKLNGLVKTAVEDYNAQVGRVRALEDKDRNRDREVTDYYGRINTEYAKVVKELNDLRGSNGNGNGNGNGTPPEIDPSQFMTKADWEKQRSELGGRFGTVLKDATSIAVSHALRFKEPLDMEAVERLAADQRIPSIKLAYEKYIEPRVKEEETESRKKWEADKRAEIERDIRSQHKLPIDPRPQESSPIYVRSKDTKAVAPKDIDSELLAAWHGTEQK